ncbi:RTA1 like protein-domain-containing protein [Rhizoctonia solani]|nr:RTA1 like protein-domain-containing protein [Rhizoctonia solani]
MPSYFPVLMSIYLSALTQSSRVLASEDTTGHLPLAYTPNKPVAIVAGTLFTLSAGTLLAWFARHRGCYMLPFILGAILYGLGLFLRIPYSDDVHNMSVFAAMDYLILISLYFFVFGVYTLLGRLAVHLDAIELLIVSPDLLTNGFLGYQLVAFMITAIGGGMKTSLTFSVVKVGSKFIIAGMLVQLVGLFVYLGLLINFIYRMWSSRKEQWNHRPNGFLRSWLGVAVMIGVCCQNLLIPIIYRVTAVGLGRDGALSRKEYYFYTSEVMTLWGGVLNIFLIVWPPRILNRPPSARKQATEISLISSGSK